MRQPEKFFLCVSARDSRAETRRAERLLPRGTRVTIADATHEMWAEKLEEYGAAMLEFLQALSIRVTANRFRESPSFPEAPGIRWSAGRRNSREGIRTTNSAFLDVVLRSDAAAMPAAYRSRFYCAGAPATVGVQWFRDAGRVAALRFENKAGA
jgi:hypothetical protein